MDMGVAVVVPIPVVMGTTVGRAMSMVLVDVRRGGNHAKDVIL
jgi:hypothetical protein